MKVYILVNCGVEHHTILGIYDSKERAEKDMAFTIDEYNRTACSDDTYQERWSKIDGQWRSQTRHRSEGEPWPEWMTFDCFDRVCIEEHETRKMLLREQADAICQFHPMICGNNKDHPQLTPYIDYSSHQMGLKCEAEISHEDYDFCMWREEADSDSLKEVYAKYLSNRSSAT